MLQFWMDKYIHDVSKHKLASERAIATTKSLSYIQLVAVMQQFVPDISCLCVKDCKYVKLSSNALGKIEHVDGSRYKDYPITFTQVHDGTTMIATSPVQLCDALVCFSYESPFYVPIMSERCLCDKTLHQMTLVFDTKQNFVFLHDPNGRSLHNDYNTDKLLGSYIDLVNRVLVEYGKHCFKYVKYNLPNTNLSLNRIWITVLSGNCVVASMAFMILFHDLQDMGCIKSIFEMSKKKEYDRLYTALYNKIEVFQRLLL
jgi:hypothetical protein